MQKTIGELKDLYQKASFNKDIAMPYIYEYYNVHDYSQLASVGVRSTMARILNSLIKAVKEKPRLPWFLLLPIDMDILVNLENIGNYNPNKDFPKVLRWFTKQIKIIIKCKRITVSECKPGAVFGDHPKIIYIKAMRCNMYYPPTSKICNMCAAQLKYNEVLNTAVAEVGHNIMNITDCSEKGDFKNLGQITTYPRHASILAAGGLSTQAI